LRQAAKELRNEVGGAASESELEAWVEQVGGGRVVGWHPISGGNRCRSWAVDVQLRSGDVAKLYLRYQPPRPPSAEPYTVWREAEFYRVLSRSDVPAPRLIAINEVVQAILTERSPGKADFRRLRNNEEKQAIADDFIRALAKLHAIPLSDVKLPGYAGGRIADCVRTELDIWRSMYEETDRIDPLIDLALAWLYDNIPDPEGSPVFVHGDAGPGNFLFESGHMTALLDWELAHAGDPMEDLAWFSMRDVMEPVSDFPARIREYERASGASIDVQRILYHRVFVSTRVVIIRHRNVTGEPGNSIVSRALNRRLLVDALAAATGITVVAPPPLAAEATERTIFYDGVLDDLRDKIAAITTDGRVVAAAKNAAKVVKYLREADRLALLAEHQRVADLAKLFDPVPKTPAEGNQMLREAILKHQIAPKIMIQFFAGDVAREAQIAAMSSGGLAERQFPKLKD
jgi:aminoglycoside phosphotransferase (APT) family kinase protein